MCFILCWTIKYDDDDDDDDFQRCLDDSDFSQILN